MMKRPHWDAPREAWVSYYKTADRGEYSSWMDDIVQRLVRSFTWDRQLYIRDTTSFDNLAIKCFKEIPREKRDATCRLINFNPKYGLEVCPTASDVS